MTSSMEVLANEYPGDAAWQNYVSVFRASWEKREDKGKYLSVFGDEELAIVLTGLMGHPIEWFGMPVPALEKRSPEMVLRSERDGLKILRSLLMRMPQ